MQERALFVLIPEYADWEPALLAAGLRRGFGLFTRHFDVAIAAPTLEPVRSIGGFRTLPDCTIADAPDDFAALILVGGTNWWGSEAEAVLPLVRRALEKSAVLGAICDASMFLGVHGFLNSIPHTSNNLEVLKEKAGSSYTGEKLYREGCPAVRSGRIVTASGAGFSDFALLLFGALEAGSPEAIAKIGEIFRKGIFDPRDLEHTPE